MKIIAILLILSFSLQAKTQTRGYLLINENGTYTLPNGGTGSFVDSNLYTTKYRLDTTRDRINIDLNSKLSTATAAATYSGINHTHAYNSLNGLPALFDGNYNSLTNKPTLFTQATADGLYSALNHTHTFASNTSKPTTLSGYGITDAYPLTGNPSAFLVAGGNIGAATGTSLAVTGALTSSGGGIGYATGNGGTVTQATNKSTGVTLNKLAGDITLNAASLAAAAIVSFTLTNSTIAATDIIHVQHQTTGTFGAYTINGRTAAGSAVISIRNNTAGALAEAIVIKYIVVKSVTN